MCIAGPSPSQPSSEHQCLTKSCCVWRCQLGFTMSPNFLPYVSLFVSKPGSTTWKLLMDHCRHITKKFMASSTSEVQKRAESKVVQLSNVLLNCPGISQLVNTMIPAIPDHIRDTAIWTLAAAQPFACSNDNSTTSACHINVTRATDVEAVELPIIGFNVATYHDCDAEVGGPLKGPFNDTFRPSPRFRRTRASFLCITRLQRVPPPTRTAKTLQRTRERSLFRSAQWRRATELCPHRLAFRSITLCCSVTWRKRHEHCRQHTQYERCRSGTDFVRLRRRRSHFGAALSESTEKARPTKNNVT